MNKSESIANLAIAMSQLQSAIKQPAKSADNPFYKSKYVPLEDVVEAILEHANDFGLSFTQWAINDEHGRVGVASMIMHESGEWIEFPPLFMKSEKDTAQGAGSVITYARRYSLSAIFGITSDLDDDANEASNTSVNEQKSNVKKFEQPKKTSPQKPTKSEPEQGLTELKQVYQQFKGSLDGFEDWVARMDLKGMTYIGMANFLREKTPKPEVPNES
jgi:hypothetical protein